MSSSPLKEAPGGLASKKDGLRAAVLKAAASMASNAAAAKEAAASSEEEEEEEEKPKGEAGIAGEDFASRMKRQMQVAPRLAPPAQLGHERILCASSPNSPLQCAP